MPEQAWRWSHRIFFSDDRGAPLDWGTELWNWDISRFESAAAIESAFRRIGRPFDNDNLLYYATRTLLTDVVDAAGGVERAYDRLRQAMECAQARSEEWASQSGRPFPENAGMSDGSVEDAWYSTEELIIWTRVLLDRLRRKSVKHGFPDQGLIPAMAEGPRREAVIQARSIQAPVVCCGRGTLLGRARPAHAAVSSWLEGRTDPLRPCRLGVPGSRQ